MASLANLTSGTTFAAKARAAELNAVRAQKAIQAMQSEYEASASTSVPLGTVKLSKPGNRGSKAWKPLNLSEFSDQVLEGEKQSTLHSSPAMSAAVSEVSSHEHARNPQVKEGKRAVTSRDPSTSRAASLYNQDYLHQFPLPGLGRSTPSDLRNYNNVSNELDVNMQVPNSSHQSSSMYPVQGHLASSGNQLRAHDNFSGYQYSVRPSTNPSKASNASTMSDQSKLSGNEDPFTEQPNMKQPRAAYALSSNPSNIHESFASHNQPVSAAEYANNPRNIHSSIASQKQPAVVKGTMDYNFRFPQPSQPHMSPQPSYNLDEPVTTPRVSVPTVTPGLTPPSSSSYTRDSRPYSSYSASKKEFLLQNLDRQVAESEARGDLPRATRTVLYDPLAQSSMGQPQSNHPDTTAEAPEAEKEALRTSDPLPWHNRPVSIFNSPTAYTFDETQEQEYHARPTFPPGLCPGNEYIHSLTQPPKRVERSTEELEAWWHNDTRAHGIPRATLNELSDACYSKEPPGYRRSTDSFSTITSPISAKTCSPIAAIGAERAAKSNLSANSTATSNDIDDMLKQVCLNFASYVSDRENGKSDHFARYAPVPEWCIDKGPRGDESFFGDWGVPPNRLGRDPRYRPTFHEGRYTVFEEMDRRGGQGPTGRRFH
ncbi:MAG: hypothetical protein Q9191_005664 [Dirinaria sp. TL-2023a]